MLKFYGAHKKTVFYILYPNKPLPTKLKSETL